MTEGGLLAPILGPLVGVGAGRGVGVLIGLIGLASALIAIVVFVIGYQAWIARSDLVAQAADYRREPAYLENMAKAIPADANLIGLTQDYGYPKLLNYQLEI